MNAEDIKARDIMSTDLITSEPHEELSEVLGRMRKHNIQEIPVVSSSRFLGVISYDTLMKRKNIPLTTRVDTLISVPPRISPDDSLAAVAAALMSSGHRALPVTLGEKLIGIVSRTDVAKAAEGLEELSGISVGEIMTPNPQCIYEDSTIIEASTVMKKLDERSVPVVDRNGRIAGVVGVKDLVEIFMRSRDEKDRRFMPEGSHLNIAVEGVMKTPFHIGPEAKVTDALGAMLNRDISSVIVTESERPVGILTKLDIIELIASQAARDQVYVQITGLEEDSEFYEVMYGIIQKSLKRVNNIVNPKSLSIHVVQHHGEGFRTKFSLRVRLLTDKKMYYARTFDWDLFKTLDGAMDQLEKAVKREKEMKVDERKVEKAPRASAKKRNKGK